LPATSASINTIVRIYFYLHGFFPKPLGATYSALRLAQNLREMGVTVTFLVEDQGPDWRTGGVYDGFPVQSFRLQQPGKLGKARGLVRFTRYLLRHRKDFDLLHVHGGGHVNLFLAWWTQLIARKPALLKITSDGWDTPDGMSKQKWGSLLLYFYRRLRGVVAMTSGQADKCRDWKLSAPIAVIPNGVDEKRYHPVSSEEKRLLRRQLSLPANAFILCYAGWLGYGKGTDVLASIWRLCHQRHPDTHLLVVGDYLGARGEGAQGSDSLPRSPAIHLVGRVDNTERYLQASDVFVFPSRREGFGTVQIEAMACGLPCVVNDLPGVSSDIYPDENIGFRVGDNHVETYIRHLDHLYDNTEARTKMGALAREFVLANFTGTRVARRYVQLYQTLLNIPAT
jgi:glycosyltransferase involved in cell wall biosynthesis